MRCTDCWFLHNKINAGRNPQSCADLGEQPQNEACSSFRPRGQASNPPLAPTEVQLDPDKPIDFDFAVAFRALYGEQLQIERDLHETTKAIQEEFFRDQANAQIETTFERYAQRLADLRLLHVLCGLFECDVYRDAIMTAEIERLFGLKLQPELLKHIRSAVKEFANADLLRVPHEPKRTPVGSPTGGGPERKTRRSPVPAVDSAARTTEKS